MLLLDTHAFIWLASDLGQLSERGRSLIAENAAGLAISAISGLEVALAVKRGRLNLPMDPSVFMDRALRQHGVSEIPVTVALGCRAAQLPDLHTDPFDRIIVATAQAHGMTLLTRDRVLSSYPGARTAW